MNHPRNPDDFNQIPESIDRVTSLGDEAPTACPKCKSQMELGEMDGFMVVLCSACKGVLIQRAIFQKLISKRRKSYRGPDETPKPLDLRQMKTRIFCPGCGEQMDVHQYYGPGNVIIDSCVQCHFIYLDYGELSSLEKAPGRR